MDIDFVLSQTDSRPMYQQVMGHIKHRVAVGDWQEGMKIPSIRELAVALKVSVITIKRAYQELEHEGVLAVQHGRGAFVAEQGVAVNASSPDEIEVKLTSAVQLAVRSGMTPGMIEERFRKIMNTMMETVK